jgi:hypothetical protein
MEMSTKVLGAEHPHMLTSIKHLAFTWKGLGRDVEAVKLMERYVQLRTLILGPYHPYTVFFCSLDRLADRSWI